jgi:hypothetical protein
MSVTYNLYRNGLIYQTGILTTSIVIDNEPTSSSAIWTISVVDSVLGEGVQSPSLTVQLL